MQTNSFAPLSRNASRAIGNQPVCKQCNSVVQQKVNDNIQKNSTPQPKNTTGLPDNLKSGLENLSGYDLSHVRVHFNSPRPAQLNAHAFAQGNQIHVASGQEKHLPHEGWHVVQQMQGRVKPTMQLKAGVPVNDDKKLEKEADEMGKKATSSGLTF